jgi:hypothetical protein
MTNLTYGMKGLWVERDFFLKRKHLIFCFVLFDIPVCKLLNYIQFNRLSFPVLKTWMSHVMVGYMQNGSTLSTLISWIVWHSVPKSNLLSTSTMGKICMEDFIQIKRGAVKKWLNSNGFTLRGCSSERVFLCWRGKGEVGSGGSVWDKGVMRHYMPHWRHDTCQQPKEGNKWVGYRCLWWADESSE